MKKLAFIKPSMEEEKRIAITPEDVSRLSNPENLFFESGYGRDCGFSDRDYLLAGANLLDPNNLDDFDGFCQPKFTKSDLPKIGKDKFIFGWFHLQREDPMVATLSKKRSTLYAWEYLLDKNGHPVLSNNSFLTGKMGVLHAIAYAGKIPEECSVAVIGRGEVGKGAFAQLSALHVNKLDVFHTGNIGELIRGISRYDIIVHCAHSTKEIFPDRHLFRIKQGALLVHLGSDSIGGNYGANSIYSPVTSINGGRNLVYCVNHIPTIAYQTASRNISRALRPYIEQLVSEKISPELKKSRLMIQGKPVLKRMDLGK